VSHRSVGAPVLPFTVRPEPDPPEEEDDDDEDEEEDEEEDEGEEPVGVAAPSPGAPGTEVVGAASGAASDVVTESPSYVNEAGSAPSWRYAERALTSPAAEVGSWSGPKGRGAYAGDPITALVYTRFRHCLSVKMYIR
jgi:hypothetical protein